MLRQRFLLLVLMRLLAQNTIVDWPLQPLAVIAWASCLRETAPNVEASSMQTCYEVRGEQRKLYRDTVRERERERDSGGEYICRACRALGTLYDRPCHGSVNCIA